MWDHQFHCVQIQYKNCLTIDGFFFVSFCCCSSHTIYRLRHRRQYQIRELKNCWFIPKIFHFPFHTVHRMRFIFFWFTLYSVTHTHTYIMFIGIELDFVAFFYILVLFFSLPNLDQIIYCILELCWMGNHYVLMWSHFCVGSLSNFRESLMDDDEMIRFNDETWSINGRHHFRADVAKMFVLSGFECFWWMCWVFAVNFRGVFWLVGVVFS